MTDLTPEGCRYCGVAKRDHCQLWHPSVGWHGWVEPTREQICQRMRENRGLQADDRATSFAFAKLLPKLTGQMRAAGWTSETPIVVAEPDNTVTSLMAQLADCRPAGRAMLAVADGQPGRWLLCMVDTPTAAGGDR
jgi:hypothetical protein